MKKKLITACVMPFLAACGQNNSDIFTINDGRIDGLHGLRVDPDCNARQFDLCLTADFDDLQALRHYKNHPLHVAASDFVHEVMAERAGFDFEL